MYLTAMCEGTPQSCETPAAVNFRSQRPIDKEWNVWRLIFEDTGAIGMQGKAYIMLASTEWSGYCLGVAQDGSDFVALMNDCSKYGQFEFTDYLPQDDCSKTPAQQCTR